MSRPVHKSSLLALLVALACGVQGCAAEDDGGPPGWSADLPGTVVFAAQDGGASSIYRVAANGTGRARLFRNDDPVDPDALYPTWDDGGRHIRFTAMRDGAWAGYRMDADGGAPHPDGDPEFRLLSVRGSAPDLEVTGDAIWSHADGGRRLLHRAPPGRRVAYANVAWGPEKRFIIFQACDPLERCEVRVARTDGGGAFTVAHGRHPSWTW